MAVTAKDLAKKLNLSEAAVSMALTINLVSVQKRANGYFRQQKEWVLI